MITPDNAFELSQQPTKRGTSAPRNYSLHEATMRLAEIGRQVSRKRTRDLVALLMCHGARTWRASQPHVGLRLKVETSPGTASVRLKLG